MNINRLRQIRVELTKAKFGESKLEIEPNPCWEGYEPIGMKDDGSPNCVPIKDEQRTVKEGFPIPSPDSNEDKDTYMSRCISSIVDEYGQEQAVAICITKYDER